MSQPPSLRVPRWIQLVLLPVLLVVAFLLARTLGHVLFLFLTASVIAFTLNPLVRDLTRLRLPRGVSVALVYLVFATAVVALLVALGTVVVSETRNAAERIDTYLTEENPSTGKTGVEVDIDRLQAWLDGHGLEGIKIERQLDDLTQSIGAGEISSYAQDAISFAQGAAVSVILLIFSVVLIAVISIYMLLDMPRLERAVDRRFPPRPGEDSLLRQIEHALASYVRGQLLLSLIIGATAGLGLWIFGLVGLLPHGSQYALLFGAWVAIAELIPYLGPWLGAIPPVAYALVVHPLSALWVVILFLAIHQLEGHVVVPKVMGSALRLHPLLVIFGLAAGAEIYGLPGALIALPFLAVARAIWEFFGDRIHLEPWDPGSGPPAAGDVPVEVELVEPPPRASVEL